VSDPTRTIASPHGVVESGGDPDDPPSELVDLLGRLSAARVVVGIPRRMDGSEGDMAREARAFGRALSEAAGVPVSEWDERLTSEAARREIIESGAPEAKRREKGSTDVVAATLMLRSFLASRR
jgi:putative Holliday junction resolvase